MRRGRLAGRDAIWVGSRCPGAVDAKARPAAPDDPGMVELVRRHTIAFGTRLFADLQCRVANGDSGPRESSRSGPDSPRRPVSIRPVRGILSFEDVARRLS